MGIVVTYAVDEGLTRHEVAGRVAVARSLAALKGFEFGGGYEPSLQRSERSSRLYFVPSETLSGHEAARLGIRGADDLFGGVVPYPFVATKTIVHPLAGRDAQRPQGWQSWRIGGASGPEVAALEAFRADPGLRAVRACSTEAYGADAAVPAVAPLGARVQFRGVDPQAGPLVKYTVVEPHGTAH